MVCKTCHTDKDIEHFPFMQGYRRNECKTCRAAYEKLWRLKNQEHKKQYDHDYFQANKVRIKKVAQAYRERTGYKSTEDVKRWMMNNPERLKIHRRNAKSRRRAVEKQGKVLLKEWQDRLAEFNYHCAYCLEPLDKAEMEHMKPLSRGGDHDISNIVPSCPSCNRLKSTKTLVEIARTFCAA